MVVSISGEGTGGEGALLVVKKFGGPGGQVSQRVLRLRPNKADERGANPSLLSVGIGNTKRRGRKREKPRDSVVWNGSIKKEGKELVASGGM